MVGRDARMRVSSPMTPFLSGTLKSTRTNTRRPVNARSRILRFAIDTGLEPACRNFAQQVDAALRVAPLVVVPGQRLDEVAVHDLRIGRVDDRRVRIAAEV